MHIYCRACNKLIAAEDISLERAIAKCRHCHALFGIADLLDQHELRPAKPRFRPQLPQPSWFWVEEWGSELTISYRWATWSLLGLAFFCLFWDGFLVVWYSIALFGDVQGGNWLMIVFPVLHVAVGIGLTYSLLMGLCNSTVVRITGGELTIRHGPFPALGNHTLATDQIDQLYCSYFPASAGTFNFQSHDRHAAPTLCLVAILRDGTRIDLLTGLPDRDVAGYLEQKLEEKLKIEDRPVGEEIDWN